MHITTDQPQHATSPNLRDRSLTTFLFKFLVIGLITQLIYIVYIIAFPLISNTQAGGPAADLEILMRSYRWFAPFYTLGILLLYFLFWQAMRLAFEADSLNVAARYALPFKVSLSSSQLLKTMVVIFGLSFGFTLVWLYPITANDIFRYVLRSRIWVIYGQSPLLVPPNAFPNDPYIAFAGEFGDWVSGYGPLWEIMAQVPLRLGAVEMVPATVGLKLIVLLCYLLCAILIGWLARPEKSSSLAALTFFTWNPLILMQGPGNGHNDMLFMALLVGGLIFWQRRLWLVAVLLLTLATLAKAPALLMLPLFGVLFLREQPTWPRRLIHALAALLICVGTMTAIYAVFGPLGETLRGVSDMLTTRRGFAIASGVRMVLREVLPRGAEAAVSPAAVWGVTAWRSLAPCNGTSWLVRVIGQVVPCNVAETLPRTTARHIFVLFYLWLLVQLWRNKLDLVTACFLAYFSQLMLGRTFRIWYPMWLIPLAALHLTPATFWRTFLFSLAAELSIINYFVVWRWWLRTWPWDRLGLLTQSYYWPIMHTLTVPWLFGLPLFGPIFLKWAGYGNLPVGAVTSRREG